MSHRCKVDSLPTAPDPATIGVHSSIVQQTIRFTRSADGARLAYAELGTGFNELTQRELDILRYVACGLNNAEIAERAFIGEKTVRNHLSHIFEKLDVDSRSKAIVLARERGLVR